MVVMTCKVDPTQRVIYWRLVPNATLKKVKREVRDALLIVRACLGPGRSALTVNYPFLLATKKRPSVVTFFFGTL
jgi:hypothetical protein